MHSTNIVQVKKNRNQIQDRLHRKYAFLYATLSHIALYFCRVQLCHCAYVTVLIKKQTEAKMPGHHSPWTLDQPPTVPPFPVKWSVILVPIFYGL